MDYSDLKLMDLDELKAELERIRNERWIRRNAGEHPNFQIDRRYLAVRHAINRLERVNTKSTQAS